MVEWWNIGIMGFAILPYWVNDNNRLVLSIKTDKILKTHTIPSLHYSIIPGLRQILMLLKVPLLFK
jgi:hypothetical protein